MGTLVTVAAGNQIWIMQTSLDRVADLIRAWILIIAIQRIARQAGALRTLVIECTRVAITTGRLVRGMKAAARRVAGVGGADVSIIAFDLDVWNASASVTRVPERACVAVAARQSIVRMLATAVGRTEVGGADISVIAINDSGGLAFSVDAIVPGGTLVGIGTVLIVGEVLAGAFGAALVVRARIVIATIQERT